MNEKMFCYQCQETAGCKGCTMVGVCGKQPDVAAMQDLLVYVSKGLSAVTTALRREGQTMVMVTHDIPESVSMSNRVVVLSGRPARIKQIHTIELGNLTPLERRDDIRFNEYSNEIWKELRES